MSISRAKGLKWLSINSMMHISSWEGSWNDWSRNSPHFMEPDSSLLHITSTCHLSLSWARSIQSVSPHPTYSRSILIKRLLLNRLWARKVEWTDFEQSASVCWLVLFSAGTQNSILRHTITVTQSLLLNIMQTTSMPHEIHTVYTPRRSGLWLETFTILLMKIQALWKVAANRPGVIVPTVTLRLSWLRFFRAFPSVVRQMPSYNSQRRGTAPTLLN